MPGEWRQVSSVASVEICFRRFPDVSEGCGRGRSKSPIYVCAAWLARSGKEICVGGGIRDLAWGRARKKV